MSTPCIKIYLLSNRELEGLAQRNWLSILDQHDCSRIVNARPKRRNEFMLSRVLLRYALGQMLPDLDMGGIEIAEQKDGQPVAADAAARGVQFNISHSGAYVAVAVSTDCPDGVGIDVEHEKPDRHLLEIAAEICAEEELVVLNAFTDEESSRLINHFYRYWTRKEAVLKSRGLGIGSVALNEIVDVDRLSAASSYVWSSRVEDHALSVAAAREFRLEIADVRLEDAARTATLQSFPRRLDPLFTGPVSIPSATSH